MTDRYVVVGLAHVRAPWFSDVSRWATAGIAPIDFVKCVSVEEVRAHLTSGRSFSALLLDAGLPGLDRDLVGQALDIGCAVVLVDDGSITRDHEALGVSAMLPTTFDRTDLLATLDLHARAIGASHTARYERRIPTDGPAPTIGRAPVIAVTGAGGTGTSVLAMALARSLAERDRAAHVLLADLALDADQAMLHDARDIVPSVQELVDAFRHGSLTPDRIHAMTYGDGHAYRVLLGLRRHRDWTALRPRAWYAALDQLRATFTHVVADIEPDLEGESQTGSFDVEERNVLARSIASIADVVVVTGHPGVQGVHRLVRVMVDVVGHGVPVERMLPVVNRAPRSPRARAELSRAIAELTSAALGSRHADSAGLLFVGEHRRLDAALRDGLGPPAAMGSSLGPAVAALLDRSALAPVARLVEVDEPVPVRPGSLGSWAEPDEGPP